MGLVEAKEMRKAGGMFNYRYIHRFPRFSVA
jgi:hypothetical protein